MLNPSLQGAAGTGHGLRLCSVCDGIDAVMLFAAWFARMPSGCRRTDLSMAEAMDYLSRHSDERFDQIILVPNSGSSASPRMLEALISEALRRCPVVLVLLPQKARLRLAPEVMARVKVLRGPPFTDAADPGPETPEEIELAAELEVIATVPPRWKQLMLRRKPGAAVGRGPAAPVSRPDPELPQGLSTIMVLPASGGVGGTTVAVNLAAELALADPKRRVCLLDLNLQFGNVSTYTGLASSTRVVDAYRSIETLDGDAFGMCLQPLGPNIDIFPGPGEILPVDGISAAQLHRMLELARDRADLVVVDLPHQILDWSGAAFAEASVVLALCSLDVRSSQNMARLHGLMSADNQPLHKFLFLLNRAPAKRSTAAKAALAEFEKANGVPFFRQLAEGGEEVILAGNASLPLHRHAPGNPLRKSLQALAREMHERARERAVITAEMG